MSGTPAFILDENFRRLVLLTREHDDPILQRAVEEGVFNSADWPQLAALALRHRIETMVALTIARLRLPGIPREISLLFSERVDTNTVRTLRCLNIITKVSVEFSRQNASFILLKGVSLAKLYREVSARTSIDIDLWVHPDQLSIASELLVRSGLTPIGVTQQVRKSAWDMVQFVTSETKFISLDGTVIELHWRLDPNPNLIPWEFEDLFGMTERIEIAGCEVEVLKPAPLYVYLCCHGAKHFWLRLKWLTDLWRLSGTLTDIERAEISQLSAGIGAKRIVAAAERLLEMLYGNTPLVSNVEIPSDLLRLPFETMTNIVERHEIRLDDVPGLRRDLFYRLSLKRNFDYRLSVLLRSLFDLRDVATLGLPRRWLLVYAMVGPALAGTRLLRRHLRREAATGVRND